MSIEYFEENKIFHLETKNTSYIMGINMHGGIQNLYWGEKVDPMDCCTMKQAFHSGFDPEVEREREEFSPWGGYFYSEPSLKVTFSDGVRDLKMIYSGHETQDNMLTITVFNRIYDLKAYLIYKVIEDHDLIERNIKVENSGRNSVAIENLMSAVWIIPKKKNYRLTHVTGRWGGETQLRKCMLTEGKKVLESRQGFTSSKANPWFAIDDGTATEDQGSVWFGALGWSGNWKLTAEKTSFNNLRIVGGINDFDFKWELKAGETIDTPVFTGGFSRDGFGQMSRNLHKYELNYIMPVANAHKLRKVLYNSWEATEFNVNVEEQKRLAERAAQIGVELFVIDDGWFGARNSDRAGLGDWYVSREKFPDGLEPLIAYVNSLGMDFGLWVEPEMVNPDSDLFRAHPDWIYHFPGIEGTMGRNQYVLNLARDEVQAFILDFMTKLLSESNIAFIKWDMNRSFSEPGWLEVPESQQREMWVRHVQSIYKIWKELRNRFPNVIFESCAGGGSRIDLGIMRYADQFWPSDNTDAFDRLFIQEGFSYVYAPKSMMCWVTESPNYMNGRQLPLSYRFHSSMTGSVGIGGNLSKWSSEQMDEAAELVKQYKEIRHIVQEGELYRLNPPGEDSITAVQYVSQDKCESVVFAFNHSRNFGEKEDQIYMRGLEPSYRYSVVMGEGKLLITGNGLTKVGIPVRLSGDFSSVLIRIKSAAV